MPPFAARASIQAMRTSPLPVAAMTSEPVPAMLRNFNAIANTARNPYSSLLWFEFQASAEGQKIVDEYDGLNSFIHAPNSGMAKATQGKKLSLNSWNTIQNTGKWEQMAFKALGFPRGEEGK